uniref:PARP catalytic domain-containing protein n=1 Tax=Maylandia zebra TaxID=106582 RepID=A0A3P9CQT5_9CICH
MFISRVLVGDFTIGSSDYRRPPSKDGGGINFYDSCVNDVMNPSIYVVFEKERKKTINAEHKDDTVVVVHLSHFALLCTDERTLLLLESNTWKFP